MSRPARTTLDPRSFEYGKIARQHATVDQMFVMLAPDAIALVMDALVERLPEPERSVLQCHAAGMSNAETGRLLGHDPDFCAATGRTAKPIARRTIHRWQQRGAERLREWMASAAWMHTLLDGHMPPVDRTVRSGTDDGATDRKEAAS